MRIFRTIVKYYAFSLVAFVFPSCNKSLIDVEDNFILYSDTLQNRAIYLQPRLPSVIHDYKYYSNDKNLYEAISIIYDDQLNRIIQLNRQYFGTTNFSYHSDSVFLNVGSNTVSFAYKDGKLNYTAGTDHLVYYYDNYGYLQHFSSFLGTESYFYLNGNLDKSNHSFEGVGFSTEYKYYDSIFLDTTSSNLVFDPLRYITQSNSDPYRYLSGFGKGNRNLLKSIISSDLTSSVEYNYKWEIANNMIQKLEIYKNDTVVRKVIFKSYY